MLSQNCLLSLPNLRKTLPGVGFTLQFAHSLPPPSQVSSTDAQAASVSQVLHRPRVTLQAWATYTFNIRFFPSVRKTAICRSSCNPINLTCPFGRRECKTLKPPTGSNHTRITYQTGIVAGVGKDWTAWHDLRCRPDRRGTTFCTSWCVNCLHGMLAVCGVVQVEGDPNDPGFRDSWSKYKVLTAPRYDRVQLQSLEVCTSALFGLAPAFRLIPILWSGLAVSGWQRDQRRAAWGSQTCTLSAALLDWRQPTGSSECKTMWWDFLAFVKYTLEQNRSSSC